MTLEVRIPRPPGDGFVERLESLLDGAVRLVDGPRCDVLVNGVPGGEELDGCRALVIPWAGVPRRTRELLLQRDPMPVYNLHHNAAPTAELAVALMLAAAKRVIPLDRELRGGDWRPRYDDSGALLLEGRTALVLGHGAIGKRIDAACRALGMAVLAPRRADSGRLRELLARADVLFVCVPWTDETEGMIGAEELARLPDGAVLVNVARGPVVEEEPLFAALRSGRIRAGLDVWYRYPESEESRAATPPAALPFHELDNVVMSPHRGGDSDRTEELRASHLAALLNALARGEEAGGNRVDLEAGY